MSFSSLAMWPKHDRLIMTAVRSIVLLLCVSVVGGGLWLSCASRTSVKQRAAMKQPIDSVLVLPFKRPPQGAEKKGPRTCRDCEPAGRGSRFATDATDIMTQTLIQLVSTHTTYSVLTTDAMAITPTLADVRYPPLASNASAIWSLGREAGAEGVLFGTIYRFVEREGRDYGINAPASVAFDLYFLSVVEEKVLWKAAFDETQQSLLENVLALGVFIKRKGRWVTAKEMAAEGLKSVLRRLPKYDDHSGSGYQRR